MPFYPHVCPKCRHTESPYAPIHEGPGPINCEKCNAPMRRDFSHVHVQAMPVAWREENRVSDEERKLIRAKHEEYQKSVADTPSEPAGKKFKDIYEAHAEASRLLRQGGEANGVEDGRYVGLTPAQAKERGLA